MSIMQETVEASTSLADGYKPCKTCKAILPESRFQTAKSGGKALTCKRCVNENYKSRHPERLKVKYATARKKQYAKAPKKTLARNRVYSALKAGTLVRGVCEQCSAVKTQAHHDDYDKPLSVRWLCAAHHSEWHRINGEAKNG